ncbi:MAG: antibiotic biosynthesis monooxygenase [Dehalococcoidia bacterium]
MAIRVVVELLALPGKRSELVNLMSGLVAAEGAAQPGFLGSTRYEVIDNPDLLVEIADWESAEARAAHMRRAAEAGLYAPVVELLATPFTALEIRELM